ncbi:hypothetical protein AB4Y87_10140 [Paenarthrobacter sp. RAF54_2]|uniref:hypothetical protein n=1 Tax=Paenarthrobacter sp. RAF54_2 TaxID=3233061 RepID=UPI003F9C67D7
MTQDGWKLLERFLTHPVVTAYDREIAELRRRPQPFPAPFIDWLDGLGAIETRAGLKAVVDASSDKGRLDYQHVRTLRSGLKKLMEEVKDAASSETADRAGAAAVTGIADEIARDLARTSQREVDALVDEAAVGVANISKSEEIAEKTLGKIGDLELASYYIEFAEKEAASANNFRKLTVLMVLLATGTTLGFVVAPSTGLNWLDVPAGDYVHLIQRAIFLAAVFALAGYFARQANQHRTLANWAGSLAIQLRTFDAYLAAIENLEVKDRLRETFAARVFGDHPTLKGEPSLTPSATAMDTAAGVVARLSGAGK